MHGPSEGVNEETDEANSAVKIVGGNVFVELDPDHPGFKDEGYRSRRNEIAKIALEWNEMSMDERRSKKIPHAPYSDCLLYTSPSPRDSFRSRMPSSA